MGRRPGPAPLPEGRDAPTTSRGPRVVVRQPYRPARCTGAMAPWLVWLMLFAVAALGVTAAAISLVGLGGSGASPTVVVPGLRSYAVALRIGHSCRGGTGPA